MEIKDTASRQTLLRKLKTAFSQKLGFNTSRDFWMIDETIQYIQN